jgi:hypothetical protein
MVQKRWPMLLAFILFFMLLGGYYGKLSLEIRSWIVPLIIFAAAGLLIGRMKQLQYELRSASVFTNRIVTQEVCVADSDGNELLAVTASPIGAVMTFYDENHDPRITLEMSEKEPVLKLVGERGASVLTFDERGLPSLALKNDAEETIWSAP